MPRQVMFPKGNKLTEVTNEKQANLKNPLAYIYNIFPLLLRDTKTDVFIHRTGDFVSSATEHLWAYFKKRNLI